MKIENIPAEVCKELTDYNFTDNRVSGRKYEFIGVKVTKGGELHDIINECSIWIRSYCEQNGAQLRKTLQDAAHTHFGDKLKIRDFDNAYTKVFSRKRGRPRKSDT